MKTFTINFFSKSDGRETVTITANNKEQAIAQLENVGQIMSVSEHSPEKTRQIVNQEVMNFDGEIVSRECYLSDEYGNPV